MIPLTVPEILLGARSLVLLGGPPASAIAADPPPPGEEGAVSSGQARVLP